MPPRLIALDLDGTLLTSEATVSPRNLAALRAAEAADVHIVIATGRRHAYAMRVLRGLGLSSEHTLISSNGTVTRTLSARLIHRAHLPIKTALWLITHVHNYRDALVVTFDKVGPDGEDTRGALVVESLERLHSAIGAWMRVNEPYTQMVDRVEDALLADPPIQMMLAGTLERMRLAEALLLEHEGVSAVGVTPQERIHTAEVAIHRTEYPARNLCIVDILPAGCSKGEALLQRARDLNIPPEEVLAIGDNWNDVSMLDVAGHAVLLENAPEDLKEIAKGRRWQIGPNHNHDGVAWVLESFFPPPA
jgi:hypothetical protein